MSDASRCRTLLAESLEHVMKALVESQHVVRQLPGVDESCDKLYKYVLNRCEEWAEGGSNGTVVDMTQLAEDTSVCLSHAVKVMMMQRLVHQGFCVVEVGTSEFCNFVITWSSK